MRTLVQRYYGINIYRVEGTEGAPAIHEAFVMMRNRRGTIERVKRRINAAMASLRKMAHSKWERKLPENPEA